MASFKEKGADLVVTVDCGAVSHGPIAEARAARARRARLRPPSGARDAARGARDRRSQPAGRSLRASAISAPPASSTWALVALNRALREAGFFNGAQAARPDRRARPRRARDRRRRRAARRPQPRVRDARARGDAPARARRASPLCSTSPAPTGRRAPITSAISSARASTRAGASATPRSARGC